MTVEIDVPARMRDGVVLRANVYRPEGDGPWPTLLARLPYSKDEPAQMFWLDPLQTARKGFMVVVQDTRGRFRSEGRWVPYHFEREDGYDSVEWAAGLPGSNGRVGMYGLSYFGNTQWMAAVERPPSLAAIAPGLTWSDPLDGGVARGGALELDGTLCGAFKTGGAELARQEMVAAERQRRLTALLDDYDRLPVAGAWELPVHELAALRRRGLPDFYDLRMLVDPEVRARCQVAGQHDRVTVPTFHIGGWYDSFLQGTLDNYMAMAALGRPARLVVGPWTHAAFADPVGDLCFGLRSHRTGVAAHEGGDVNDLQLAWFGRHLGGDGAGDGSGQAPVRIFVMGRNRWRDEAAWPPERARVRRWFLRAGGVLGGEAPGADAAATAFVYDPADPVPTLGGNTRVSPAFRSGPVDQARVEARRDVCVFSSEPLGEELEVTGRVRVVLHARSSAPSTDWVARVCDVHPDGRSFNVCDGIVRVREGADRLRRMEIDLWSTSNVFLAGHCIRVHVTSSSFPRWDRNLNTGNQHDPRFQIAEQVIHHDAEHPSWIELPVIAA